MTYQDPDPLRDRNLDPTRSPNLDPSLDREYGSNAMWGWIAGGIVLALVLMFVFSNTGTNTNTAAVDNGIPPASTTTGSGGSNNQ